MSMFRMRSFAGLPLALWVVVALLLPLVASGVPGVRVAQAMTTVFFNELHYDNDGTDTGEAIEIAGPAGTDLTGWSIVLYNGNGGAVYDTRTLSGTISDLGSGYGVLVETYPTNGIQNGSPDGLALVDSSNNVVQFLSYEGTFTAVGGPADGLISTDIGVAESSSTPAGFSLQLTGIGTTYEDFTWSSPSDDNFGQVNTGQSFGGDPVSPLLVINEIDYDQPGSDTAEFIELYNNGSVSANLDAYSIELINGNGNTLYDSVDLPNVDLAAGDYFVICADSTTTPDCDLAVLSSIQNGAPDAAAIVLNGQIVDTISYEGEVPGYTEGSGAPADPATDFTGLSRFPDGIDTDDNNTDFSPRCITPGEANTDATTNCPPPGSGVIGQCGDPATLISTIQGSGNASSLEGQTRTIEGVVVGDFQEGDNDDTPELPGYDSDLDGFYVQEENSDWDADPATSEGIFVYAPGAIDVSQGDRVRVTGEVTEFFDLTELTNVSAIEICGSAAVPTPTDVLLPVATLDEFERYEGMLVRFPQSLVIAEYFNFDRFGEIVLAQPLDGLERPFQPTSYIEPGPAVDPVADAIERSRITLDDARSSQNPDPARHPNGAEFTLDNRFRGGDIVKNAVGVLDYRFGKYRIQPTQDADYTLENPRPAAPEDVGGNVTVASFNVLNYFTTLDNGPDICGPAQTLECRGADNATEFERQHQKIVAALAAIDADIFGLVEMENTTGVEPLETLLNGNGNVSGLNAEGIGTYDYIDTGTIGTDAIRVGFIYDTGSVEPVGNFAILTSAVDPAFDDTKNRPALAQTFRHIDTGEVFTVVVNHLKSKGSSCGAGDDDPQQGNCNLTRTRAAEALVDWLATDPTGSGDPDFMIIGDLNAYDEEDPIDAIKAGGYVDLIELYEGEFAYSFVFDGQFGYLDYALVNQTLLPQVTGTTEWHINADEPDILDYDTTFKQDAQDALYAPNPYRSSDHDPVIVGLNLEAEVEPVEPLTLTSICNAADGSHQWRVRNPNDFDVPFTWQRVGTSETGEGVALASSDTFFFTPTAGTVKIFWDNNGTPAETVKAANNEPCTLPTGNITIVKEATPAAPWLDWTFDGDLGAFTLDNDSRNDAHLDRQTFEVAAGSYTVNETNKRGNWDLEIVCESSTGESTFATDGTAVTITLAAGDDVTCTYNNLRRSQIRITKYADTNGNGERDADEAGLEGWQVFLYLADGNGGWQQIQPREVRTNGRGIANYTSLEPGVDHLVCEEDRTGWSTTEPANPIEHDGKICQVVADLVYGEVRRVSFGNREEPMAQTLYRARQVGARVWIERNVEEAGLGDFDPDGNGWALVGRTNGAADNGELRDFFVEEGVPYAIVFNRSNNKGDRCILLTPRSLDVVKKGQTRLMTTVEDPVACPVE